MLFNIMQALDASSIVPTRNFNLMYVIIDSIFTLLLLGLLIYKKKYVTLAWALFGGVLYYLVDYGYFHLISGSRTIIAFGEQSEARTALVLLWMSLSYGISNFIFIWVCLNHDKDMKEFLILIIGWWLIAPTIATIGGEPTIMTSRTTGKYHGAMAIFCLVSYLIVIIYNLVTKKEKIKVLKLILIGFFVQFSWEFALLVNGIRPMNEASIMTLLINSCIETNLGLPAMWLINKLIYKHFNEDFSKKKISEPIVVNP